MNRCYVVNHMRRVLGAMMLIGLVCTVPKAHAQIVAWSATAAGCTPDSATVLGNLALTSAVFGGVTFRDSPLPAATGNIRLTCPVSGFREGSFGANTLEITFYAPTIGPAPSCRATAILLRSNLNELERGNTIASVTSTDPTVRCEPQTGKCTGFVFLPENIDFNTSHYWIDAQLTRQDTSCDPTMVGVHLSLR